MNKKLLLLTLIFFNAMALSQNLPPTPDPGCGSSLRVGMLLSNNQNTQHFVNGISHDNEDCSGIAVNVHYDQLQADEFAYAQFDSDRISEYVPTSVDFSIDLSETMVNLPINKKVKIAELMSTSFKLADLSLRKILPLAAVINVPGKGKSNSSLNYRWMLTVRWLENGTLVSNEDHFYFNGNETINYNYIFDESDPNFPVSLISLGGDKISVNPFGSNVTGLVTHSTLASQKLSSYHLGFIETSAPLVLDDKIVFKVYWQHD